MALGVEEKSGIATEYILPEFGRVDLSWFDPSKKYRGAIFRLNPEAAKQICEIIQFTANFEFSGIKTAVLDLMKTEGFCVMEIERNAKPPDIGVRYSKERWELLETASNKADNNRPWLKAEFDAAYISDKVIGLAAEQLRMVPDKAINFIIRLNFKDKTFAVVGEEQFSDQMPSGGFSQFNLPNEQMLVLYEQEKAARASDASTETRQEELSDPGAGTEPVASAEPVASDEPVSGNDPVANSETASPAAPVEKSEPAAEGDSFFKHPIEDKKAEEPKSPEPIKENEEPLPGSTKALEKFITRKENRPKEDKTVEVRRESIVETAKYSTYSRSEVDHMLKQQTENITSALGSKISSQQRVFQEAVDKQEKSFAKLSDGFVNQFDQTRTRLENMSKQSEETIRAELETFKRELSKELDQHRAQLNKTIVPVAKFIEDKNVKPEKAQKEIARAAAPSQAPSDGYGLKPLLFINLILMLVTLGTLFASVMPDVSKVHELQMKLDEINAKLGSSKPATGSTPPSSTADPSSTTSTPVSSSGN